MKILISGATGFIGTELVKKLISQGHKIHILSRKKLNDVEGIKYFIWDPDKNIFNPDSLNGVEGVINLAGTNVGEKRWTKKYKDQILNSRVKSLELLTKSLTTNNNEVKVFVSASAIGIYGSNTGDDSLSEDSAKGNDFLANVVNVWESELWKISKLNIRTIALRLGIVLSEKGGALPKLILPIKNYFGSPLASGKQYISWVDIDDVIDTFLFALSTNQLSGPYNVVAPEPVTNEQITRAIANKLNKPLIVPNVPSFILKIVLGEFSDSVIGGNKVSCQKLLDAGFKFQIPEIQDCLRKYL